MTYLDIFVVLSLLYKSFCWCHVHTSPVHSRLIDALFLSFHFLIYLFQLQIKKIKRIKMLRFLFAFFVFCLSLLQLSMQVEAAVCPPANSISPSSCSQYITTTTYLNCQSRVMADSQVSDILNTNLIILWTLVRWGYSNCPTTTHSQLTRVPVQMQFFTQLECAFLYSNLFTSIKSRLFNVPADIPYHLAGLSLSVNHLMTIAPDAFEGFNFLIYSHSLNYC